MKHVCAQCHSEFKITKEDLDFYNKINVPPPTFCPDCRFRRRCSWINARNFFPRKVGEPGKTRISMYSQDLNLNIVSDELWWSDTFDFFDYGREYDFQESFFAQFHLLLKATPLPHLQRNYATFQNSEYCNAASALKDCYLIVNADNSENCMYGFCVEECKSCLDIIFTNKSELCYESVHLKSCYECMFCEDCEGSDKLLFCRDCVSCHSCIGCVGLRQKSYHIFNKPYSKEEYQLRLADINVGSFKGLEKLRKQAALFLLKTPKKYLHGRNNQDVHGDYIYQSKNVKDSYIVEMAENCRFCHLLRYLSAGTHDAYDYTIFGVGADLVYESAWCGLGVHNIKFSIWNYGSSDIEYCIGCHSSSKLFGCIGLRHKKYCVFNKQYSKSEYESLVARIKEQMNKIPYIDGSGNLYRYGEFFPSELSPFHYNQTIAQDFCPLSKLECNNLHLSWNEHKPREVLGSLSWINIPDNISEVNDDILDSVITCKAYEEDPDSALKHNCTQYFKITAQELKFYKKMNLSIPRYCYNSRHYHKLGQINAFKTWKRVCGKCNKTIESAYAPQQSDIVYCEECYLSLVY